jgi:hypothetical protein
MADTMDGLVKRQECKCNATNCCGLIGGRVAQVQKERRAAGVGSSGGDEGLMQSTKSAYTRRHFIIIFF